MANLTSTTVLNKVKNLEKELEFLKMEVFLNWRKIKESSVVKKTSGILGRKFPSGVKFENAKRKEWEVRFKKL